MYLIDTNVISEIRKGKKADAGVLDFFKKSKAAKIELYLSVVTIGELRRGIEQIRYRNDLKQANLLEIWFQDVFAEYQDHILEFDVETAQVWGKLRVPQPQNFLDKQIAATALIHDLIVVTRNTSDFQCTGVKVLNPFSG